MSEALSAGAIAKPGFWSNVLPRLLVVSSILGLDDERQALYAVSATVYSWSDGKVIPLVPAAGRPASQALDLPHIRVP